LVLSGTGADVLDVRGVGALVRYTLIRSSQPLSGERAAEEWLATIGRDASAREQAAQEAVAVLNRAIAAYRVAAGDPYAGEVSPADAESIRFGAGTPRQVMDGDCRPSVIAPRPNGSSSRHGRLAPERLEPTRAVAAALGDRVAPLAADALTLRALLDLRLANPVAAAAAVLGALEALEHDPAHAVAARSCREGGLLDRARDAAHAALIGSEDAGSGDHALHAAALQLRERLRATALAAMAASDAGSEHAPTRAESTPKVEWIYDGRQMVGEFVAP
jgi:hypothetical protein